MGTGLTFLPKPIKPEKPSRKPISRVSMRAKRKKRPSRFRKTPMGKLKKRLDVLFSKYVRDRDALKPCITCNLPLPEKFDASHFVPRGRYAVRWHPKNVHGQHSWENLYRRGELTKYAEFIVTNYGEATLRALNAQGYTVKHWTRAELEELIGALERDPSGVEYECIYLERYA